MDMEKLARALDRDGKGAALEKAFQSGDDASLKKMLGELLATPEGKSLAEDVGRIMER